MVGRKPPWAGVCERSEFCFSKLDIRSIDTHSCRIVINLSNVKSSCAYMVSVVTRCRALISTYFRLISRKHNRFEISECEHSVNV